jgi:eukaryotic-like serine/threonine-protein kinase
VTPERFRLIETIYCAALERGQRERAAFVAHACAGDEALRREVESLLDEPASSDGFLEGPARAVAVRLLVESTDPDPQSTMNPSAVQPRVSSDHALRLTPGQQFGPYRIERLLGRGGMGEVYEAEHVEQGRRVALKMLTQRLSDATDRARFLREGQFAAAVSHPHIVYIYGSEEIAGIPVIAMELLPGGTLKDRVENTGPLAPVDAIDTILQVISGLEAVHAGGVLHRDMKPSNCFVDVGGTIKVGDFGLSIPTLAHTVTQPTTTRAFQGTPEFASPEQLRGERLDVRSDIYAVGATLYYLLTGRAPFEDRDLMALMSPIATEPPPSLREGRPEIPRALAKVVLQCLAKDPADRPATYHGLAGVLEPLGSSIKTTAPIGIRFAAGVFDSFFTFVLLIPIIVPLQLVRPSSAFGTRPVLQHLVSIAYFAFTESVWGASLGKALCGLRVVTESGTPPGFTRTLFRALVFVLPAWFAIGLLLSIIGRGYSQWPAGPIAVIVANGVGTALLFVTARRADGFAGLHEWTTHTRTVLQSAVAAHRLVRLAASPIEVTVSSRSVGPYQLVEDTSAQTNRGAALGYDEGLRRMVWLQFPGLDADPVPHVRRVLRRATRPRWLGGQRTSALAWDAYERVPGQPFDTFVRRVQSWKTVCGWLRDLAEEVHAGLADGSLPALECDRVWIGDDGRARLLDWSTPMDRQDSAGSLPGRAVDLPQAERFLHRVAISALEGGVLSENQGHVRTPQQPLPMPATACLGKLREQRFTTSDEMLAAVISAASAPAGISRTKRAVHLSLCGIPTILMFTMGLLFVSAKARPGDGLLGMVIAGQARGMSLKMAWGYIWLHAIVGPMIAGAIGLLSALATRGGIALRLMNIAVVTKNGAPASGSRARLRAVLSWSPVLVASVAAVAGQSPLLTLTSRAVPFFVLGFKGLRPIFFLNEPSLLYLRVAVIMAALAVFALAVILAVIRPDRGLQDRLAGTWLVPG